MKKFINRRPANAARWALGMLPFVLLLIIYMLASDARLAAVSYTHLTLPTILLV